MKKEQQEMQQNISKLLHRSAPELHAALRHNARAHGVEYQLMPVPHSETGVMPSAAEFPQTVTGGCLPLVPATRTWWRGCCLCWPGWVRMPGATSTAASLLHCAAILPLQILVESSALRCGACCGSTA